MNSTNSTNTTEDLREQIRIRDAIYAAANASCMSAEDLGDSFESGESDSGLFCPLNFDNVVCWKAAPAGTVAHQPCPDEYIKALSKGMASRDCSADGTWSWGNYSECGGMYIDIGFETYVDPDSEFWEGWLPIIKTITQCGYVISIVALLLSLFIFIRIKRLHCARNTLHVHLFLSFVMRGFMSLLKDGLFLKGTTLVYDTLYEDGEPTFIKDNYSWVCKAIISLRHYIIISNYMFLLMEGTYLHNLMFLNLFAESGVTVYCVLGWGLPTIFVIPWIVLKAEHEDNYCWTQRNSTWIAMLIEAPIGLSVVINFVLFVVIIRVLFVKLTSMYIQQRKLKYRKLLRSTLILVPLFGIPYTISLILSFHVSESRTLEVIWLLFDQSFIAFQGLFATLVYCFLNSEVQTELKRKYCSFKDRNNKEFKRSRTISHTQQLNEELQEIPNCAAAAAKKPNDLNGLLKKTSDYF